MNEVRTTQKLTNKEKRGKFLMKIGEAREFDESYSKGKRMSPLGLFRGHSLGLCTPAAVENALPFSLPSSFSLSLSLNINTYSFPYRTAPMGKLKPSPPSSRDPSCLQAQYMVRPSCMAYRIYHSPSQPAVYPRLSDKFRAFRRIVSAPSSS